MLVYFQNLHEEWTGGDQNCFVDFNVFTHPVLKREDRLGKEPFAGFGTVVEDITGSGYTKNQPILLGPF